MAGALGVAAGLLLLGASAAPTVELYTRPGCPHCEDAKEYLRRELPGVAVVEHDVVREPSALSRLEALTAEAGVATPGVPTFVVGGRVLVGFEEATTPGLLRDALRGAAPPPAGVELPLLGRVELERLGLPLFTVAVGLVDGFNPCATWVLLFLLGMLVHLRDRRRMALVAGTFVVVSGAVYYAFMAAWLGFFQVIGVSTPVRLALAAVAIAMGLVNLKDFFAFGRGPSLSIPASAKPGIYRRARAILSAENLPAALAGTVALAFLVNLVELLCTAGLPALYTGILTSRGLGAGAHHAYLALYIAAYMVDDAILVTIGVATLGSPKLRERGGRWLKLLSGVVIVTLGVLLLVRPRWMRF